MRRMLVNFFPTWALAIIMVVVVLFFAFLTYSILRKYFSDFLIKSNS